MKRTRTGQSTLEYVIIVAILVGLFVTIMGNFQSRVRGGYNHLSSQMQKAFSNQ